jgi:hypothetical protein
MGLLVRAHFYFQKKGKGGLALGRSRTTTLSHNRGSSCDPQGCARMVIPVKVELKSIVEQARHYPWPKPECCPR